MEYSLEALRKVQLQERHQPTLTLLPEDFYDQYAKLASEMDDRLRRTFSLEEAKAAENAKKSLHDIFELRKQKIFFKALKDFQAEKVSGHGLAGKEKELYTGLVKLLSSTVIDERPKSRDVEVEVLADMPAFVGLDAKPYGPFKAGQTVFLNVQQAVLLGKKGVVKVRNS